MNTKKFGFSLIELLIVITIIGILAVVMLPKITSGPARARDAQRITDVASIAKAVEMYAQDNDGAYPGAVGTLTTVGSLPIATYFDSAAVPVDPQATNTVGTPTALAASQYGYRRTANGFQVIADTETNKVASGYYQFSSLATTPVLATATDLGEANVYAYIK